ISNKELTDSVEPETARRSVDPEQIEQCRAACREFVPDLADGEVVRTKVCLYDMTENSDFVIDRDPDNRDIVYGYGFSGQGSNCLHSSDPTSSLVSDLPKAIPLGSWRS